jgi:hypothetical protein
MAARKAQMFVATAVFLASMLFIVQQAMITYATLDMSGPFQTKQIYMVRNIIDSVNVTIRTAGEGRPGCQEFQKNLEELLYLLKDDVSSEGYLMEASPLLDCGKWDNIHPEPAPLILNLRFSETYDASGNVLKFYHKQ